MRGGKAGKKEKQQAKEEWNEVGKKQKVATLLEVRLTVVSRYTFVLACLLACSWLLFSFRLGLSSKCYAFFSCTAKSVSQHMPSLLSRGYLRRA